MDIFNLIDDSIEFIENEGHLFCPDLINDDSIEAELNELLLTRSSDPQPIQSSPLRPIDLPSHRKHYGLLTFYQYRIPIIFRLSNSHYVPYIRFSHALNVLDQYQSNRHSPTLDMVKNLPILDMTSAETVYYDRITNSLSSSIEFIPDNHSDWSNKLLSVGLLDCLLGILDCSASFFQDNNVNIEKWDQILYTMRQEVKSQWSIEEKSVLSQVEKQSRQSTNNDSNSLCISSTNIAQRRLFFEKRLDLAIVEESGGFVQIDSFIFPYIKDSAEDNIYINVNDIHDRCHQYLLLPSSCIRYFSMDSPEARDYNIIIEQARENFFRNSIHGSVYMSKRLPNPKTQDFQLKFLSLDVFLQSKGACFAQLFEKSSLDYLTLNYKNQFGRDFVMSDCSRQGGFINNEIPYIRIGKDEIHSRTWIPTETKTSRVMTQDERLFINCLLLYQGHWKTALSKEQRWYLEEIDVDIISSVMSLFDREYYERQQRKLFGHC